MEALEDSSKPQWTEQRGNTDSQAPRAEVLIQGG